MDSFEYIIIGSGPAGVSAALKLEGPGTCVIDIGEEQNSIFPYTSFQGALASSNVEDLLGKNWEMLANLADPLKCHPKLRAGAVRHVMQGESFNVIGSDGKLLVRGHGSFAAGGMANVWGAQLLRYTENDLSDAGGWPISISDLIRHYNDLEAYIGISGEIDDMSSFLGYAERLLPPFPCVPVAQHLLTRYAAKRDSRGVSGLIIGRPRLAVLTRPHGGRPAYEFGEMEFFKSASNGLYSPHQTLIELCQRGQIQYLGGHKLLAFSEHPDYVEIEIEETRSGRRRFLRARHLMLGCGTVQTSRLVLMNRAQVGRKLPFIDHSPTLLPIFFPMMFGSKLPISSFPIQLIGTLKEIGKREMISFYYPSGMLWSDLLSDIPMPLTAARSVLAAIIGGLLVAQIWEAAKPSANNHMSIELDGTVTINYAEIHPYTRLFPLLTALRRLGGISLPRLASMPPPSWGFHHVGTLPMRFDPKPFETHLDGRLWDSRRVRIIDGSVLPSLPAKNHSLTIMANSARIAECIQVCGY